MLDDENGKLFDHIVAQYHARFAPMDEVEADFVQRIAESAWRLRRAVCMETAAFNCSRAEAEITIADHYNNAGAPEIAYTAYQDNRQTLESLHRYEQRILRLQRTALDDLVKLRRVPELQTPWLPEDEDDADPAEAIVDPEPDSEPLSSPGPADPEPDSQPEPAPQPQPEPGPETGLSQPEDTPELVDQPSLVPQVPQLPDKPEVHPEPSRSDPSPQPAAPPAAEPVPTGNATASATAIETTATASAPAPSGPPRSHRNHRAAPHPAPAPSSTRRSLCPTAPSGPLAESARTAARAIQ